MGLLPLQLHSPIDRQPDGRPPSLQALAGLWDTGQTPRDIVDESDSLRASQWGLGSRLAARSAFGDAVTDLRARERVLGGNGVRRCVATVQGELCARFQSNQSKLTIQKFS